MNMTSSGLQFEAAYWQQWHYVAQLK